MMLFDTNAILAAILPHREHHTAARLTFSKSKKAANAYICVHTLAEAYNTLSGKLSIPPQKAIELLRLNLEGVQVLALEPADYHQALERMAKLGLGGGGIYDALLAELAVRNNVKTLLTFNLKHFIRLGKDVEQITKEPQI